MPTKLNLTAFALAGLLAATLTPAAARADELSDKGRAVFSKNKQAVVTVMLAMKNKFSGMGATQATEAKTDATGTVIDPSGLTVLSLSATDPSQLVQNMVSAMSSEGDSRFKMESELSDVKILLADGTTEVPAEVVLRDKDLDLAFIRPKVAPAAPMAAINLADAGKAEVLDQIVSLNRLGNAGGRAYAANEERISAVVQKPRLFYVPMTSATTTALGCPAFTLDGKPLGIFLMRALKGKGSMSMVNMQPENVTAIILPAAEILKAAAQVPAVGGDKKGN